MHSCAYTIILYMLRFVDFCCASGRDPGLNRTKGVMYDVRVVARWDSLKRTYWPVAGRMGGLLGSGYHLGGERGIQRGKNQRGRAEKKNNSWAKRNANVMSKCSGEGKSDPTLFIR